MEKCFSLVSLLRFLYIFLFRRFSIPVVDNLRWKDDIGEGADNEIKNHQAVTSFLNRRKNTSEGSGSHQPGWNSRELTRAPISIVFVDLQTLDRASKSVKWSQNYPRKSSYRRICKLHPSKKRRLYRGWKGICKKTDITAEENDSIEVRQFPGDNQECDECWLNQKERRISICTKYLVIILDKKDTWTEIWSR